MFTSAASCTAPLGLRTGHPPFCHLWTRPPHSPRCWPYTSARQSRWWWRWRQTNRRWSAPPHLKQNIWARSLIYPVKTNLLLLWGGVLHMSSFNMHCFQIRRDQIIQKFPMVEHNNFDKHRPWRAMYEWVKRNKYMLICLLGDEQEIMLSMFLIDSIFFG